jgi:hypothetical protein
MALEQLLASRVPLYGGKPMLARRFRLDPFQVLATLIGVSIIVAVAFAYP